MNEVAAPAEWVPPSVPPADDPTSTTYSVAPADAPQDMAAVRSFMLKAVALRPVGGAGWAVVGGAVGDVGALPLLLHDARKVTAAMQSTRRLTARRAPRDGDTPRAHLEEHNCGI